ncbi:hypothetical protein [Streptomyces qinglanensis]|uniref:hypothetical protein n=1 Tax=Streptomyces qinglanensis TaxID=943816 RepID=UPI003D745931
MLFANDDFEVVDSSGRMPLPPVSLLEALPQAASERALWWEGHILEVLRGLPPEADAGAEPKPQTEIADAVAALPAKAHAGPGRPAKPKRTARDKRVVAQTRATGPTAPVPVAPTGPGAPAPEVPGEDTEPLAEVIPLGLFNPLEDPWRRT